MYWIRKKPILLIPFMLLSAFLLLPLLHRDSKHEGNTVHVQPKKLSSNGFFDYDLIPEKLRKRMDEITLEDTVNDYRFYYYFNVDDINRHFYLIDAGLQIVEEMSVKDEKVFDHLDQILNDTKTRTKGLYVVHNTTKKLSLREPSDKQSFPDHKLFVFYVLPEGEVDYSRLRVTIVRYAGFMRSGEKYKITDTTTYAAKDLVSPPYPVRGLDYFREAVIKSIPKEEIVAINGSCQVTIAFTVGHTVQNPEIVTGYGNKNDSYEAYQADGALLRAIHFAKVVWVPGMKDGKPVKSRMQATFDVR